MAVKCSAVASVVVLLSLAGCSARRPVVYPNEQYQRVGQDVAERDIDECMRRAEQFVKSGGRSTEAARNVAGSTTVGAGTGAAIGAVGGAVGGGGAGQGAAVGAATGATAGFLHGMFGAFGSQEEDPVFMNFVDRCLRERGYEPIGWE
jgi:hypothetical protein